VPAFINKENEVRIAWNPHKKEWVARCTTDHKLLFATLRGKPKAEWLDELESRRWQEKGFGRVNITVIREDPPSETTKTSWGSLTLPPLSTASGHTAVTGSGSGGEVKTVPDVELDLFDGFHETDLNIVDVDSATSSPGNHSSSDSNNEDKRLRAAFALFDTDGSGYLDKDEFRYIMSLSGTMTDNSPADGGVVQQTFEDAEFEWLFAQVDTDRSGTVSVEEYLAWVKVGHCNTEREAATQKRPLWSAAAVAAMGSVAAADGLDFVGLDSDDDSGAAPFGDLDDDSDDDPDEEPSNNCILVCCGVVCMSFLRFLGRCLEVAEAGEWIVDGSLNLALGDYFASFRFAGRLYWVYLQIKMLMLAISIVFLQPFPIIQAGIFLFCEILHLLSVLWVMPFINFWNHCAAVISSVLSIFLFSSFVGLGSAADPSTYSSLYVFVMLAILAQALATQMWPILVIIAQLFKFLIFALDMSELLGGADEGPSESAVTLQRAAGRLKLINIPGGWKAIAKELKADEGGAVVEETSES
jgi:Ca2+-binding EF-hand superfamily protein